MIESEHNLNVGFKDSNEFCLYIETLKLERHFESYIETLVWYSEHESDLEIDQLAKHLNKKLKESIAFEAMQMNMLKENSSIVSLF